MESSDDESETLVDKRLHASETALEKCRVCKITLRRKNYKAHLKNVHPKEDSDDLSGYSQPKITSMFSGDMIRKKQEVGGRGDLNAGGRQDGGWDDNLVSQGDHSLAVEGVKGDGRVVNVVQDDKICDVEVVEVNESPDMEALLGDDRVAEDEVHESVAAGLKRKADETEDNGNRKGRFKSGDSAFSDTSEVFLINNTNSETLSSDKLNLILEQLQQVKSDLKDLKEAQKKPKKDENIKSNVEDQNSDSKETLMLLLSARSMEEIEGIGFDYDEENCKVKCVLCDDKLASSGDFKYNACDGLVFSGKEKMSRNFINLKAHLKAHILKNKSHCSNLVKEGEKNAAECELFSKNRKAGLNLGRAAAKNYIKGRPYTDYESDILIMKKAGGIVGEINHSRKFPAMFRKSYCRVVNGRVRRFVQTPLKQTGHLPPVAVSADKGTYKGTPR